MYMLTVNSLNNAKVWDWKNPPDSFLLSISVFSYINNVFPDNSAVKNRSANAEEAGSIPGLGKSPGEGNGHPLQYSCLGSLMDRGTWWATVHLVAESDTTVQTNHEHDTAIITMILPRPGGSNQMSIRWFTSWINI